MATLNSALTTLFTMAMERRASDIHVTVGRPPVLRIDGQLYTVPGEATLTPQLTEQMLLPLLSDARRAELQAKRDVDFSFGFGQIRFRVNVFHEKNALSGAFRLIPLKIWNMQELGLPPIVQKFTTESKGLVIVTGPTGHGKSTTLASIVDAILSERSANVITLEDPIEFLFEHRQGMVTQRELGADVLTFSRGLRAALREDPDVVLIGEMRDQETIEAALTVAETGHLVLSTLHTNSAAQTADRIISVFPQHQQQQVRTQLAAVLLGVMSQRLLPRINGGRVLATEVMLANSAVRTSIREGKTHQLDNVISTSNGEGMIAMDKVLANLVSKGDITFEEAMSHANDSATLKSLIY